MSGIFLFLLNTGISACPLIIAAAALRRLLVKAPKYINLVLWAMVGIRLLCPLTVESVFSLSLPSDAVSGGYLSALTADSAYKPAADNTAAITAPDNNAGYYVPAYAETAVPSKPSPDAAYSSPLPENKESAAHSSAPTRRGGGILTALPYVWLAGFAAMSAYGVWSFLALKKRTAASIRLRDDIYVCDGVGSPFVLGIASPRIIVPSGITLSRGGQLDYIVAHERSHIARGDHVWKPLGFALLAAYWFHPLVWLSYILFCRDIEYACDERVVRSMDMTDKREYSRTLLEFSVSQRSIAVCPVAFGEVGVKNRVSSVLSYKKPAVWIVCAAAALCAAAGVCFMTSPVNRTLDSETEAYLHQVILERGNDEYTQGRYPVEDHIILKADKKGDITTVYALVWYGEYEMKDSGEIEEVSGWHIPSVITLDMSGEKSSDYWEPEDGAYFVPSIRKKFPFHLWNKAINIHRYSDEQDERCMKQAQQHFLTADIAGMNIGAEMPRTVYADEHIVIMTGTFGMLVYDMDKHEIRDRLSHERLQALGLNYLQSYISAKADSSGEKVLLCGSDPDTRKLDYIYVYDVGSGALEKRDGLNEEAGFMTAFDALHSPLSSEYDDWKGFDEFVEEMGGDYLMSFYAADIGDSFIYTRAEPDWDMSTLQIVRKYYGKDKKDVFDVFPDVPKQSAALEPVPLESIAWDACAVNYIGEGWDLMSKAGAYESPVPESGRYVPVLKISGEDGLADFRETAGGVIDLDSSILDGKSFDSIAENFDAAYFDQYDLLLVYLYSFDMGTRFTLGDVSRNGNKLSVSVTKESLNSGADLEDVGWLMAVSVPREQTGGIENIEAFIGSVISDD